MSIHLLDRLGRLGTHENPILPYIFCHCQIVHTPSHLGNMTSEVAVEPALLKDDNPGTEKPTSNTEVIGSFSSPGWCVSWNVAGRTGDAPMPRCPTQECRCSFLGAELCWINVEPKPIGWCTVRWYLDVFGLNLSEVVLCCHECLYSEI